MEPSLSSNPEGSAAPKSKLAMLLTRHYKTLAWIGFALWLLTMYAILFQMDYLFS